MQRPNESEIKELLDNATAHASRAEVFSSNLKSVAEKYGIKRSALRKAIRAMVAAKTLDTADEASQVQFLLNGE